MFTIQRSTLDIRAVRERHFHIAYVYGAVDWASSRCNLRRKL